DPDQVDLHRFRRMVNRARAPDCSDQDRAALLRGALALWQGEPLADLSGEWTSRVREACRRQRVDAAVLWAQTELRLGNAGAVIEPLSELVHEYPVVEPLTGMLMRALHAAGRTAEALDCYTNMRKRLVDDLGTEPGSELQAVH